ncbi:hypothetical protein ACFL6M_05865 [Candidatus Eisenbacteria bacterium]|uniref:Uncharacterized protein n=1 Tax=Eiseniibacteriota bacterium TaxID=2212470 RepID=A0ABV6YLR1_UNCEI
MGCREPFAVDFDHLHERMTRPALAEDLKIVHMENAYDLLDCIALSGDRVANYLGEGPYNTEDRPLIEFRAPRNMSRVVTEFRNLQRIMQYRNFPQGVLASWGASPEEGGQRVRTLQRYYEATGMVLQAHQYHLLSQVALEVDLLKRALEINPDDRDAPFLGKRLSRMVDGKRVDW